MVEQFLATFGTLRTLRVLQRASEADPEPTIQITWYRALCPAAVMSGLFSNNRNSPKQKKINAKENCVYTNRH